MSVSHWPERSSWTLAAPRNVAVIEVRRRSNREQGVESQLRYSTLPSEYVVVMVYTSEVLA